ncbi:uncharacterized protein [Amphiura filiformis]|uniref:uncharacterized protein n=1 Tax=Amphiura filiformis TaxID=82378 RepID=UPI003B2130ED
MAKTIFVALLICLVMIPEPGWSCLTNTGRIGVDTGPNSELRPTFDPSGPSVGVEWEYRWRREAAQAPTRAPTSLTQKKAFTLLDLDKNKQIQLEEWVATGGEIDNFDELLKAKDTNGDAMISWEEFPPVHVKAE